MFDDRTPLSKVQDMNGLTSAEAAKRLACRRAERAGADGRRLAAQIALEVAREPMLLMLIAAGLIYIILGDIDEAADRMLAFASTVDHDRPETPHRERAGGAARPHEPARAGDEDGAHKRIAGREVVRGDLVLLTEGDRVPADATLIAANDCRPTNRCLPANRCRCANARGGAARPTGRVATISLRLFRFADRARPGACGGDGDGGPERKSGRFGKSLAVIESEPPPIQHETRRLVRWFAIGGVAVSVLFTVLYGWLHKTYRAI